MNDRLANGGVCAVSFYLIAVVANEPIAILCSVILLGAWILVDWLENCD